MKKIVCLIGAAILLGVGAAGAQVTFTDTFNRADTTSPGGGLGSDWTLAETGTTAGPNIYLSNHAATSGDGFTDLAAYNGATLLQGFRLSDTFTVTGGTSSYAGLIFDYTDPNNYYALRVKVTSTGAIWQMIQEVNGAAVSLTDSGTDQGSVSLSLNTPYTVQVVSTGANLYAFTLTNASGTVLVSKSGLDLTALPVGGEGGIYFTGGAGSYVTQFTEAVPEPDAGALFGIGAGLTGLLAWRRRGAVPAF